MVSGGLLLIDVRNREEFSRACVIRCINIPLESEGVKSEFDLSAAEALVTEGGSDYEQRLFSERRLVDVWLVGSPERKETQRLASLLKQEAAILSVTILDGGFYAFQQHYSFLCCDHEEDRWATVAHRYPHQILPYLFLGSDICAQDLEALVHLGVTHIVNATVDCKNHHKDAQAFEYLQLPLKDNEDEDIGKYFASSSEFISKALEAKSNNRVLVHCAQGISRSVTIVLAHLLISRQAQTLKDAFAHVSSRREQAFPNNGFWIALEKLERKITKRSTLDAITVNGRSLKECIREDQELANRAKGRLVHAASSSKSTSGLCIIS